MLLDLPGIRVRRQDVEAWEKKTGIRIGPGDALLLRSHRPGAQPAIGAAGYDPSLIPFLKERDIALLGNDSAQEGGPVDGVAIPIHTFTIVALGLNLLDNLALDEVAATADRLKRWEFMLVVAPLRMENGAGSPGQRDCDVLAAAPASRTRNGNAAERASERRRPAASSSTSNGRPMRLPATSSRTADALQLIFPGTPWCRRREQPRVSPAAVCTSPATRAPFSETVSARWSSP